MSDSVTEPKAAPTRDVVGYAISRLSDHRLRKGSSGALTIFTDRGIALNAAMSLGPEFFVLEVKIVVPL